MSVILSCAARDDVNFTFHVDTVAQQLPKMDIVAAKSTCGVEVEQIGF